MYQENHKTYRKLHKSRNSSKEEKEFPLNEAIQSRIDSNNNNFSSKKQMLNPLENKPVFVPAK